MSVDHIRYDLLVREALRGVVRRVLSDAAANGLPGEHHFYVSFDTRAPGVRLSPRMRAQYPEEMTIVLQHQFWDLGVTETALEVGLSFNGVPERLSVPFEAIKGFFDPSVQFGLELDVAGTEAPSGSAAPAANAPQLPAPAPAAKPQASKPPPTGPRLATVPDPAPGSAKGPGAPASDGDPDPEPPRPDGGGEVVRLDRFRKK